MKTTFQRNVSPVERMFIILAETDPPFCNQMIIEGSGVIDEKLWEKAVAQASEANPSSRVLYEGRSVWGKWVDSGVTPPIRYVDGSNWSGNSWEGAPFLYDPLPFRTSHSAEVIVIKGDPIRVVFRTLHATMDGGGNLMWANDVFRALRNEPLVGWDSPINDKEFLDTLKLPPKKAEPNMRCLTPTGRPEGKGPGFIWNRITIEGKFSKLLPQMALALAKEARKNGPGNVRIAVPLELRRRIPDTTSSANLTRRIYLEVPPESTIESLAQQLRDKLKNLEGDPSYANMFGYLPSWWMRYLYLSARNRTWKTGIYKDSGTISNGGLLPVDTLHGGGFVGERHFWIPPILETKPLFISTVGYGNYLEFITAMPKVLGSNGRLEEFTSNVVAQLKPKE